VNREILLVVFMNSAALDTTCSGNVHRLPLIRALSEQLNGTGKVLLVAHYISLISSPLQEPGRIVRQLINSQPQQYLPNVFIWVPWVPWNVSLAERHSLLLGVFRQFLQHSLRRAIEMLKFDRGIRVAWLTHPYHLYYRGLVSEKLTVYECYDDFVWCRSGRMNNRIRAIERQLARESDVVLATAQTLYHRLKEDNTNTHYFPNAVEFSLFSQAIDPATPVANQLTTIPKPVVGFMGNLSDWYDFSLLLELITSRPKWSFVFVGEVAANVHEEADRLRQCSNVFFLGWQKYEMLPSFLKGFDVAIMPYKLNTLMQSVNPNKMYQLMAAGLPIVSTPIPEALCFSEVISTASDAAGFAQQIELCLSQLNSYRRERQMSIAARECWDKRAEMALWLIEESLKVRNVLSA